MILLSARTGLVRSRWTLFHCLHQRNIFTCQGLYKTATESVKKSSSSSSSNSTTVTQKDLDRLNRQHIERLQDDIQKSAQTDLFGGARRLLQALLLGFTAATVASISYGR